MKIFLIGKKGTKCDQNYERFRTNLAKVHDVIFYGEGYWPNYNWKKFIPDILSSLNEKPDIILVHAPVGRIKQPIEKNNSLYGFNEVNIPKIHVIGDYLCGGSLEKMYDSYLKYYKFDLIFISVPKDIITLKRKNLAPAVHLLPFSVDTSIFFDMGLDRSIDVMASFSKGEWYANRKQLLRKLIAMNLNLFYDKICHEDYVKTINKSKIFVCGNNINNNISAKYNEVLACNTLFIVDKPDELEELGYENGKHLVIYENLEDMQEKVLYYLKHEEERKQIAQQGMKFVRENYSNQKMVKRFTEIVQKEFVIREVL